MFKILLGEAAEDNENEKETPFGANQESEQGSEKMAIKLEAQDLEQLMSRAMASAMATRPTATSAQDGAEIEVNATTAQDCKLLGRRPRNVVSSPGDAVPHAEDYLRRDKVCPCHPDPGQKAD